ncbi:MAG: hypothetical protein V1729_00510 [Candidatus Woesearchaeota archaeon]
MTPIEIIALLGALLILVKLVVIAIKPNLWMKLPHHAFKYPKVAMVGSLLLAFLMLYFLMEELNIIQIFACVMFTAFLIVSAVTSYSTEFVDLLKKLLKEKHVFAKALIPVAVWFLFAVWVLYAIFA